MAVKNIFKSTIENMTYIFANGKTAVFSGGRFITDVQTEINELMSEVQTIGVGKSAHSYIYVDENENEIDTTLQDKIKAAQAKAVVDIMRENDKTLSPVLVPIPTASVVASTNTLAALASLGSNSGANTGIASSASVTTAAQSSS